VFRALSQQLPQLGGFGPTGVVAGTAAGAVLGLAQALGAVGRSGADAEKALAADLATLKRLEDQLLANPQGCAHDMALDALHLDFPVPSRAHDL
jgi:hypothetical protein